MFLVSLEKEDIIISSPDDIWERVSKMKKEDEKVSFLMWVIECFFDINQNIYVNKYTSMDWNSIISEFYVDKDPMRRFKLIHELISGKYLCKDASCPVHPLLINAGKHLNSMNVYDINEAKKLYGEKSQDFISFSKKFNEINSELVKVFCDTKIMFDTQNTQRFQLERAHQRSLQKIMIMGKANVHYSAKVGDDVDQNIQTDEKMLMPHDKEITDGDMLFKEDREKQIKSLIDLKDLKNKKKKAIENKN